MTRERSPDVATGRRLRINNGFGTRRLRRAYRLAFDGFRLTRALIWNLRGRLVTQSLVTQLPRKWLGAIALIVWLATPAVALKASGHSYPLTGAPDIHITQIRRLPALAGGAAAEIEIRWTALVPRFTTINGFEVTLEVRYSDGSKNAVSSDLLRASDRTVVLRVPTRPKRSGDAVLKEFKAGVTTRFKSSSSFTLSREFQSAGQAGKADSPAASDGTFPKVAITNARVTIRQCPAGRQCIYVRWTASAPPHITISDFGVNIDVVRGNGSQMVASKTVVGSDRQARLSVEENSGSGILSFKVGLTTNFSLSHSRTIVKEGAF